MTRRAARLALRLYPLAFQRRYRDEMRALIEQTPPRALGVLDLLRGALVAHVRPPSSTAGFVDPADRVRASTSGVLVCWVVFAAAGVSFYKTTEDASSSAAGRAHPLLGGAHVAVQALAVVASAVVILGALPLIAAALAHAKRRTELRRPIGLALLPVIAFMGLSAVLVAIAHAHPAAQPSTAGGIALIGWSLTGLGCGIACVAACRAVLFAVPLPRSRLVAALACGMLVTVAMIAIAVAVAVYSVALLVDSPSLAAAGNGPFQTLSAGASLIVTTLVMIAAGALASLTTWRGWRVTSRLEAARPS